MIFLLLFLLLMTSCSSSLKAVEVGYVFHESTAWTHHIVLDSQEVPITFTSQSNGEALSSLRSLKPSILYANSDGTKIFLVGQYNDKGQTFLLKRWYLLVPFEEYTVTDETVLPHQIVVKERESLTKEDFNRTELFDPKTEAFDPASYIKRKDE